MPLTPTNYLNSVIYKIEHINNPELIYIGSTTNFIKRKYNHKNAGNNEKHKDYNLKLYQMIRSNGGFDEFKIMVIKTFSCNSKTELLIEEEKNRKEYQATLNSVKAYITIEDAKIRDKETKKEYYETNKEEKRELYKINKDKITERRRELYKINKDKINQRRRELKEENKKYDADDEKETLKPVLNKKDDDTDDEDPPALEAPEIIDIFINGNKTQIQVY